MKYFHCIEIATEILGQGRKVDRDNVGFHCPGPSHVRADKKPSLLINPKKGERGFWKCFVCGIGGGAWELAALLSGYQWPRDKKAIFDWLRERGYINYAVQRKGRRTTAGIGKIKNLNRRS